LPCGLVPFNPPPLTREQIGAALWPDASRQQLGNALHTALRELRHALGDPGWIVYANGRYAVNPARPRDCDVDTFTTALTAARQARPAAAALPGLQRAVTVYGGDFLADMAVGDWAQARRDELSRAFESALHCRTRSLRSRPGGLWRRSSWCRSRSATVT
jgi:DNA-binding SARP family transcriptional activator